MRKTFKLNLNPRKAKTTRPIESYTWRSENARNSRHFSTAIWAECSSLYGNQARGKMEVYYRHYKLAKEKLWLLWAIKSSWLPLILGNKQQRPQSCVGQFFNIFAIRMEIEFHVNVAQLLQTAQQFVTIAKRSQREGKNSANDMWLAVFKRIDAFTIAYGNIILN